MTVPVPAHVTLELIYGIKATHNDQALRQAKRHRSIVCPLASLQAEWTATISLIGLKLPGCLN
jgi:hypothetical protein